MELKTPEDKYALVLQQVFNRLDDMEMVLNKLIDVAGLKMWKSEVFEKKLDDVMKNMDKKS